MAHVSLRRVSESLVVQTVRKRTSKTVPTKMVCVYIYKVSEHLPFYLRIDNFLPL